MPAGFKLAYITTCTWFSWCQALPQESVICKDGLCKEEDSTLSMLQTVKVGYDGATEAITLTNQNSELQKALPFAWFHLPKCGSSLGNLIIHTPGVCKDLSKDAVMNTSYGVNEFHDRMLANFKWHWGIIDKCNLSKWGNHAGITADNYETQYKGHAIMMIRQPEQRILSEAHHHFNGWYLPDLPKSLLEYASVLAGCYVKLLTRDSFPSLTVCGTNTSEPTQDEVQEALRRMREGFVFIGITEQWDLSACLFRAKFGGKCLSSDFMNTRPGVNRTARTYDVQELEGFVDKHDRVIYAEALKIFNEELQIYNISNATCKPCFEEASLDTL